MNGPTPRPTVRFRVIAWLVILCVRLARFRVVVDGLHHVPRHGGAVVTWNHHGHVDFLFAVWGIYREVGRSCRALAKQELWRSPWTRWIVRFADAVPVDRGAGADRSQPFAAATDALRQGHLVLVAPEGTISESFELLAFRTGAVRMARAAGVPVVPSAGWGSHRLVTSGHGFSLRRAVGIPVGVAYGEPIHVRPDEDNEAATARLRAATEALLHDLQERYPDGAPAGTWWAPARLGGGAPPDSSHLASGSEPPFEHLEPTGQTDATRPPDRSALPPDRSAPPPDRPAPPSTGSVTPPDRSSDGPGGPPARSA